MWSGEGAGRAGCQLGMSSGCLRSGQDHWGYVRPIFHYCDEIPEASSVMKKRGGRLGWSQWDGHHRLVTRGRSP
jgi:hypothetical protein